ncbi:hypothetical protein [Paraburkholderia sp. UYCP14C]|uniref:hypothetical protein n=1 Tax=Paraburkholderia sp. UYCP14C TaxID=2511130 RepID=UPI002007184E|nr:hypothetical protein [Paraburkholderia sp. UYCP14C]
MAQRLTGEGIASPGELVATCNHRDGNCGDRCHASVCCARARSSRGCHGRCRLAGRAQLRLMPGPSSWLSP